MAHLSPSAVFSPSIARQQQAAAKDWNYVDSWLNSKFRGKAPPIFERNNETLKALLALAACNESADEERELLAKVEVKALDALHAAEESDPDSELQESLQAALPSEGVASLDTLSTLGIVLQQPFPDSERLASGILDLQVRTFELEQASDRVSVLEKYLAEELVRIKTMIEELQSDAYQPSSDLAKQTLVYQRRTKALATKLPELKDRAAALSATAGKPKHTIEEVKVEEERYKTLMGSVKELEVQAKTFHGLPHDTDLARLELEQLRAELRDLTQQRDSMFEGLVERESPQKPR
ncbi:hypothetical protein BP5796_07318 [Coleophoma crateriformis]|uniref:HAUS augmin-like complex subunit 1 n=1 Tax=Coleophoma crateriformis TaxID=565419 RepID=A0A3D8RIU1_9HELO|nr:hypothetical protein BP5796_07318 [Coleophoma crateriformis]